MTIQGNDPRLTAHVLGELDSDARAGFEVAVQNDAAARAELDEIGKVTSELEALFGANEGPRLAAARRERLHAAMSARLAPFSELSSPPSEHRKARPRSRGVARMLLAALVPMACAILVLSFAKDPPEKSPEPLEEPPELGAARPWALGPSAPARTAPARSAAGENPTDGWAPAPRNFGGMPEKSRASAGVSRARPDAPEASAESWIGARGSQVGISSIGSGSAQGSGLVFDGSLGRESYDSVDDNSWHSVESEPRSTFSIDVDTASYALVRRFLRSGELPPHGAVRLEEMINYFSYAYPEPRGDEPLAVLTEVSKAPWAPEHRLLRVAVAARDESQRPPANLVFLIDVSGSMVDPTKLPLVKHGLRQLTDTLGPRDRISIVVYAGASGLVLEAASGDRKRDIHDALGRLEAGGSTNGSEGIELAYAVAAKHFARGGVNRVMLLTDGDFNVGITDQRELVAFIEHEASSGVFLSVLGFGSGNYQDSTLEKLADRGNGNYYYIDEPREARKVLLEEAASTLVTVARDVKLQLEFNPAEVEAFRLLGYENRVLAHRDFDDDTKDAGEIGSGHRVTALYEIVPRGRAVPGDDNGLKDNGLKDNGLKDNGLKDNGLKYAAPAASKNEFAGELSNVRLRYQSPEGGPSRLIERAVKSATQPLVGDFRFAAAVAEFGMLLRASPHRGTSSFEQVLDLARSARGSGRDREARDQFMDLVMRAERLARNLPASRQQPLDPLSDSLP